MKPKGKLPLGVQNFREIRDPQFNHLYVDKTQHAYEVINCAKYIFLSRPRRFGKSLFVDTLSEIFHASKELFEGLYIYDKWDWSQSYPVIKIDLAGGEFSTHENLNKTLIHNLRQNQKALGVDFEISENDLLGLKFQDLIQIVFEKYQKEVVILIDEYDKPIIDNLQADREAFATEVRDKLRAFYGAIKPQDAHIRFAFVTGVSKFAHLSLFSGLNNLTDITIDANFSSIAGYTQHELEEVFAHYLIGVDKDEVKRWYNGYNYLGEPVYNPFDILQFFSKGNVFRNYWWQSGGTKFLIDKLKESYPFIPELNNLIVGEETLNAFDVEHIELTALLWQTGNLTFGETIQKGSKTFYQLKVPNIEVQDSLNNLFYDYLVKSNPKKEKQRINLFDAIENHDFNAFAQELKAVLASIPHHNYTKNKLANYEGYYASIVYTFLSTLGFRTIAEDTTNTGRIDMTIVSPTQFIILEFKLDQPEEAALQQIKTKRYYEKYTQEGKEIYLVGIHFSSKSKNIEGFEWEKYL